MTAVDWDSPSTRLRSFCVCPTRETFKSLKSLESLLKGSLIIACSNPMAGCGVNYEKPGSEDPVIFASLHACGTCQEPWLLWLKRPTPRVDLALCNQFCSQHR